MSTLEPELLKGILAQHGYSTTKPRRAVFEALLAAHNPKTITQLVKELPDIDKVSVYRTLDVFSKIGITHQVWNGFKSKVELSEAFSPHHHHFTCINCGKVITLKNDSLETKLH